MKEVDSLLVLLDLTGAFDVTGTKGTVSCVANTFSTAGFCFSLFL